MKDMNRRDVLLIALMILSCILLAVSRPDNADVRTVVWDYTAFLMMGATAMWFLTEIFSWFGDVITGSPDVMVPRGMSKNGLVVMAQNEGIADKETLEKLSEDELIALIKTNGKSKELSKPTLFVVVSGVWSLLKETGYALAARYRRLVQFIKGIFSRKKPKTARRNDVRRKRK